MNNTIITGFEPFHQYRINPSAEVVNQIRLLRTDITSRVLKVDHLAARDELIELLTNHHCATLLMIGLAEQGFLRLETVARKPREFNGIDGPELLHGKWHWENAVSAFNKQQWPTRLSTDAGNYVCESTYWSALQFREIHHYPTSIAFLHVPLMNNEWTIHRLTQAVLLLLDTQLSQATSHGSQHMA